MKYQARKNYRTKKRFVKRRYTAKPASRPKFKARRFGSFKKRRSFRPKRGLAGQQYDGTLKITCDCGQSVNNFPWTAGPNPQGRICVTWGMPLPPSQGPALNNQFFINFSDTKEWLFYSTRYNEYRVRGVKMEFFPTHFSGSAGQVYAQTVLVAASVPVVIDSSQVGTITTDKLRTYPDFEEKSAVRQYSKYVSVSKYMYRLDRLMWKQTSTDEYNDNAYSQAGTYILVNSIGLPAASTTTEAAVLGTFKVRYYMEFRLPKLDIYSGLESSVATPVSTMQRMRM